MQLCSARTRDRVETKPCFLLTQARSRWQDLLLKGLDDNNRFGNAGSAERVAGYTFG